MLINKLMVLFVCAFLSGCFADNSPKMVVDAEVDVKILEEEDDGSISSEPRTYVLHADFDTCKLVTGRKGNDYFSEVGGDNYIRDGYKVIKECNPLMILIDISLREDGREVEKVVYRITREKSTSTDLKYNQVTRSRIFNYTAVPN